MRSLTLACLLLAATISGAVWLVTRWSTAGPPPTEARRYRTLQRAHVGQIAAGVVGVGLLVAVVVRVLVGGV